MKIQDFITNLVNLKCESCGFFPSINDIDRISCKCCKILGFNIYPTFFVRIKNYQLKAGPFSKFMIEQNRSLIYESVDIPDFDLSGDLEFQIETFLLLI